MPGLSSAAECSLVVFVGLQMCTSGWTDVPDVSVSLPFLWGYASPPSQQLYPNMNSSVIRI